MEHSQIRRLAAWLLAMFVVLAGFYDCGHGQNDSTDGSGMPLYTRTLVPSPSPELNPVHENCYPVTEEAPHFVTKACTNYIAKGKLYLYDYGADPNTIDSTLVTTEDFIRTIQDVSEYCLEVLKAYGCNIVYPGCNPTTGQPQGVCESDCIAYIEGYCRDFLRDAVEFSEDYEVRLTLNCSHALPQFPMESPYNKSDCWHTLDLIVQPIPTDGTNVPLVASVSTVSVVVMALFVGPICLYTVRRLRQKRRRKNSRLEAHSAQHANNTYDASITLRDLLHDPNESLCDEATDGNFQLRAEDVDSITMDLRSTLIPFNHLELIGDLGEGNFGSVYKALLSKAKDSGFTELVPVAVKTIKNRGSYAAMKGMLMESALMRSFDHPHVMSLIGITLNPHQRCPYLILPFMEHGDLSTFLKSKRDVATRSSESSFPEGLNYTILMRMCYQIASGMEHIASKRLVHRDLAARNCMIDIRMRVKVADFGLTRDIYQTDYYRQQHAGQIPVKWMAPESLLDRISNEKTDVWSFGVTCWEVFSLGRAPYPSLANHEMIEYLEQGHRLKKPTLCKEDMYTLISRCWIESPTGRPTFSTIVNKFTKLMPEERVIGEAISNDSLDMTSPEQMRRMGATLTENEVTASTAALVDEHYYDMVADDGLDSGQDDPQTLTQSPAQSLSHVRRDFFNAGHHGDAYVQMNPVGSLPASFTMQTGHRNRNPDGVICDTSLSRSALTIENPCFNGFHSDKHSELTRH